MTDRRNTPRFADCQVTPASRRGILGAFAALSATGASALDIAQAAGLDPDAELIALCAAHPALIDAVNTSPIDFDKCPASAPYLLSRDAIHDARPVTLEGLRAKALAAKVEARNPDGSEEPAHCVAADWAWELVHDILRLSGGAA